MKRLFQLLVIAILSSLALTACGPPLVEQFEEIKPNQTAFLVPLEGATKAGSAQFMSIDYLNEAKVATKRISIPLRKHNLGRMWFNYEWIPIMSVIKVDRMPVTREWTGETGTGTAARDQALWVESKDSIGFGVGVNITTLVSEIDAATFLYYYAGKPLTAVTDENVRGKVNSILSREFAKYDLEQARSKKNEIFAVAAKETIEEFKNMGVTITNLGLAEGLVYEDKEIQQAINDKFRAEMQIQVEAQKNLGQANINARNVDIAAAQAAARVKEAEGMIAIETAKAEAARQFAKSLEARIAQVDLEIRRMDAEARLTFAKNIQPGVLPANILPQGSSILFGLDTARK